MPIKGGASSPFVPSGSSLGVINVNVDLDRTVLTCFYWTLVHEWLLLMQNSLGRNLRRYFSHYYG
jgi:hypothetical protein